MLSVDEILEQTQWDFFWAPSDVTVVDRPELLYVHCPRDVSHLNAVTRLRVPDEALPAIFEELAVAHQDVESRFMEVPQIRRPALEEALLEHGYGIGDELDAMAIACEDFRPKASPGIATRRISTLEGLDDALKVTSAAFGRPVATPLEQREDDLAILNAEGTRVLRVVAYDEESSEPLCAAGFTAFPELSFALFWGGGTVPGARGRGAYSAVVAARVEAARSWGLSRVGLYARLATSAPICERQGFLRHGRTIFWTRRP